MEERVLDNTAACNILHMQISVKNIHPEAKMPTYAHPGDAGMDVYAAEAVTIAPGAQECVSTGITLAIPEGHVGLIWDKSGLACKSGLTVLGGVIDAGYRGEILVQLYNTSDTVHSFAVGDKVAQMLIQPVVRAELVAVDELDDTPRGTDGFGSTGER